MINFDVQTAMKKFNNIIQQGPADKVRTLVTTPSTHQTEHTALVYTFIQMFETIHASCIHLINDYVYSSIIN